MFERSRIVESFQRIFQGTPRVFSAPGRINLIGEHTDYNEGFVLPVAIEQRTYVAASPRSDRSLFVHSADLGQSRVVHLDQRGAPSGSWLDYVQGTARALQDGGVLLSGADMLITSDVPRGAGLSSSAALELSVGFALASLAGDAEPDRLLLALSGQRAEREWVGTQCGLMDQYIAAFGKPGHAILLDCRSLVGTPVPLELKSACVVVMNSRVQHDLATSEYNKRRAECEQGVRVIAAERPAVRALRDVTFPLLAEYEGRLDPVVFRRCRHVVTENERTLDAVGAFARGDLPTVGRLMVKSHESLRRDYEVSCEELDFLVERACDRPGAYGARMTGGGFGGCVIVLVEASAAGALIEKVSEEYTGRFGVTPDAFVTRSSAGAREE
jgi:galactokinase